MKNALYLILFLANSTFCLASKEGNTGHRLGIKTIVIDAGHGGHDPGAMGKHSKEKEIALQLALRVGKLVTASIPDVKVIYTRDTDEFVPLNKRAQIANDAKADLFISVHCNANANTSPKGTETYIMGKHVEEANFDVMQRENGVITKEANYQEKYADVDLKDPSTFIHHLFQLKQYQNQSIELAATIQQNFKNTSSRKDRGVKMAGFLVLYKTYMPSVLIEAGFISNLEEEAYLKSDKGQNQIATGIFEAIKNYKEKYEATLPKDPEYVKPIVKDIIPDSLNKATVVFSVQLMCADQSLAVNQAPFIDMDHVYEARFSKVFKYYYGNCETIESAIEYQTKARTKGFKGAFVVAFYKGKRITLQKGKEINASN